MKPLAYHDNFSQFVHSLLSDETLGPDAVRSTARPFTPACELREDEKGFYLSLEMPGVSKELLKIEQHEQLLTITGERKENAKPGKAIYSENTSGKFTRTFELPKHIDAARIEANYEDGVLTIHLPKVEVSKPREIKIGQKTNTTFFETQMVS